MADNESNSPGNEGTQPRDAEQPEGNGGGNEQDWGALPDWARKQIEEQQAHISRLNDESAKRRIDNNKLTERVSLLEQERQKGLSAEERLQEQEARIAALQADAEKAKKLENRIRESNQQRLEGIPEGMRSLVPVDAMPPDELAAYLDRNEARLRRPMAPNLDGGAGYERREAAPTLTEDERRIARQAGMSDEEYAKYKARLE